MFLNSIKERRVEPTNRKFINLERNSEKFKPKRKKEVRLFNENVIKSKKSSELKFTNFYSASTAGHIFNRLSELSQNLDLITSRAIEDGIINFNDERISNIIKLFITDFDTSELLDDQVKKVTLLDVFNEKTEVRVYFLLSKTFESYDIIAIDLFHLLIPSKHNGKDKKTVMNETFSRNQNNDACISDAFRV